MRRMPDCSFLFIDFNAYFASVEQQHDPALRDRPVVVAPLASEHTSAIAASYEAKALGVRMGTRIADARRICPGIVVRVANPRRYVDYHHALKAAIERVAPVEKVHSIDEMFCRLDRAQCTPEAASALAHAIKASIAHEVGPYLRCSIGIGATPLIGKIATDLQKPDGLVFLPTDEIPNRLAAWPLHDIAGIGANMERRLHAAGITDVAGLWALAPKQARAIWGGVGGERFWYALHGFEVPDPPTRTGSLGHSRVLDTQWRTPARALLVARELTLKAARRLRRHGLAAGALALGLRFADGARGGIERHFAPTQDSFALLLALEAAWRQADLAPAHRLKHISIMLGALVPAQARTTDLFADDDPGRERRERLWSAIDRLRTERGLKVTLASQANVHLQDLGTKIAFTRIPEIAEFME